MDYRYLRVPQELDTESTDDLINTRTWVRGVSWTKRAVRSSSFLGPQGSKWWLGKLLKYD